MSFAEKAADRVVETLCITSPRDLVIEDVAWERKALVLYERLDSAAARLVVRGDGAVITVSTRITNAGQRRFAVAHELGHFELHRSLNNLNLCVEDDLETRLGRRGSPEPELEASAFASALLMPTLFFRPLCERARPSLALVQDLAGSFETSLTATALRYLTFCREQCAVVWSEGGRIRWYRGTRDFGYHVRVGEELDKYSIAVDFFSCKTLPRRPTAVDASCWLAPGRYREDAMIQEDSLELPGLGAVITLLWIDKDIEREWEPGRWNR